MQFQKNLKLYMIIRIVLINISFDNVLPPLKIPFYALVTFWLHFRKKSQLYVIIRF